MSIQVEKGHANGVGNRETDQNSELATSLYV